MLQGAGLGLIFVPLTTVTNDPIPIERMGNATSLFNLMRNMGASIGISTVEALQFRRTQTHVVYLGQHVNPLSPLTQARLSAMYHLFPSSGAGPAEASQEAKGAVWGMVQRHASMLAYNDVFRFPAGMLLIMLPLLFRMRRVRDLLCRIDR